MSGRNFNEAEKTKLIQLIKEGSQVLGEIDDLKAENARLKAEVERLTKAGDVICRMAGNNQVINRHWKTAKNAAKQGGQP